MSAIRERQLRLKLKKLDGPGFSPFVCDGPPTRCRVFIVGLNPARKVPFWPFWSPSGFRRGLWLEEFKRVTNGKGTRTRTRLTQLVDAVEREGISCLTTNVFPYPSRRFRGLVRRKRDGQAFELLVQTVHPEVILVHGNKAIQYLERFFGIPLSKGCSVRVQADGKSVTVLPRPHLSTFWWTSRTINSEGKAVVVACRRLNVRGRKSNQRLETDLRARSLLVRSALALSLEGRADI